MISRTLSISFILLFLLHTVCYSAVNADSIAIKKIDSLILNSNRLLYDNPDSARVLAEKTLMLSENIGYDFGYANSLNMLGISYDLLSNFSKSFTMHKEAFGIYKRLGNEKGIANSQANMGLLLKKDKKYDEALIYLTEVHQYYVKSKEKQLEAQILNTIGNVLLLKGNKLSVVLEKMEQAEVIAKETEIIIVICSILNLLGDAYLKFDKYADAISHYKESMEYMEKRKVPVPWNLGYSYSGLSKAYLKSNMLNLALQANTKGIRQYKISNYTFGLIELYEIRVLIDEKHKDYTSAFKNLKIHNLYKDSVFNEKQSNTISQLKVEFETEKKDSEIEALSQQATIQDLELKQKNQSIVIGLVSFLLLSFGAYFLYSQKASKDKRSQIELEQRFLRSQLNPHFIFNALLAIQNYMMKNDAKTAGLYLSKFAKLMREILENSRREFILVGSEIEMLTNYLDIHKLRLNDSFDYNITIDDNIDLETDSIPPMFVQPFVENAIEHGIINTKDEGLIELNFVKKGDYISIEIKDNGDGISLNIDSKKDHTPLASTIIKERMDLFNKSLKNKIQLVFNEMKNEQGEIQGTKVELKVPFSYI